MPQTHEDQGTAADARAASFGPSRVLPARRLVLEGEKPVRLASHALENPCCLVERRTGGRERGADRSGLAEREPLPDDRRGKRHRDAQRRSGNESSPSTSRASSSMLMLDVVDPPAFAAARARMRSPFGLSPHY
jgi:hypothetical protein